MFFVIGKYFRLRRYSPSYKGCTVFLSSYASCHSGCALERKLISPTKLKIIPTFCTRFPSTFPGAWTMIFLINSLTIAGVSSFISTYLRIIAEKLSKSLLFCSQVSTSCCSDLTFSSSSRCSASYPVDSFKNLS